MQLTSHRYLSDVVSWDWVICGLPPPILGTLCQQAPPSRCLTTFMLVWYQRKVSTHSRQQLESGKLTPRPESTRNPLVHRPREPSRKPLDFSSNFWIPDSRRKRCCSRWFISSQRIGTFRLLHSDKSYLSKSKSDDRKQLHRQDFLLACFRLSGLGRFEPLSSPSEHAGIVCKLTFGCNHPICFGRRHRHGFICSSIRPSWSTRYMDSFISSDFLSTRRMTSHDSFNLLISKVSILMFSLTENLQIAYSQVFSDWPGPHLKLLAQSCAFVARDPARAPATIHVSGTAICSLSDL